MFDREREERAEQRGWFDGFMCGALATTIGFALAGLVWWLR